MAMQGPERKQDIPPANNTVGVSCPTTIIFAADSFFVEIALSYRRSQAEIQCRPFFLLYSTISQPIPVRLGKGAVRVCVCVCLHIKRLHESEWIIYLSIHNRNRPWKRGSNSLHWQSYKNFRPCCRDLQYIEFYRIFINKLKVMNVLLKMNAEAYEKAK